MGGKLFTPKTRGKLGTRDWLLSWGLTLTIGLFFAAIAHNSYKYKYSTTKDGPTNLDNLKQPTSTPKEPFLSWNQTYLGTVLCGESLLFFLCSCFDINGKIQWNDKCALTLGVGGLVGIGTFLGSGGWERVKDVCQLW